MRGWAGRARIPLRAGPDPTPGSGLHGNEGTVHKPRGRRRGPADSRPAPKAPSCTGPRDPPRNLRRPAQPPISPLPAGLPSPPPPAPGGRSPLLPTPLRAHTRRPLLLHSLHHNPALPHPSSRPLHRLRAPGVRNATGSSTPAGPRPAPGPNPLRNLPHSPSAGRVPHTRGTPLRAPADQDTLTGPGILAHTPEPPPCTHLRCESCQNDLNNGYKVGYRHK